MSLHLRVGGRLLGDQELVKVGLNSFRIEFLYSQNLNPERQPLQFRQLSLIRIWDESQLANVQSSVEGRKSMERVSCVVQKCCHLEALAIAQIGKHFESINDFVLAAQFFKSLQ